MSTGLRKYIAESERNEDLNPTTVVNTGLYKESEDLQKKSRRHIMVYIEDFEQKAHEREEKVNVHPKPNAHRHEFIKMMPAFESIWDRYSKPISVL